MKGPIETRPSGITNHLELATEDMARLIALAQEDIFAALGSRPNGLTADEVRQRAARFGPNAIAETRGPGLVRRLGSQFVHLFALLLWAGSVLAVLAGEATLAAAIAAVVLINGLSCSNNRGRGHGRSSYSRDITGRLTSWDHAPSSCERRPQVVIFGPVPNPHRPVS